MSIGLFAMDLAQLATALELAWLNIPVNTLRNLIDSLPARLAAVRSAKDCLEDRFGKYRQLSGAGYHISIMQIYECESKLRLQKVTNLPDLDVIAQPIPTISVDSHRGQLTIAVTDADVAIKSPMIPAVTYVAGYLILENTSFDHQDTLLIEVRPRVSMADAIEDPPAGLASAKTLYLGNAMYLNEFVEGVVNTEAQEIRRGGGGGET
ncbi:hypothetical protein HPB49_025471 [Dermacentor silvarum]|uniref:Uncharacterized protein n=1 Tax=Dermacentor silvarum TaxID=543639 RepID=A0ACB8CCH2_DERSI|nr:hypothetical protein HPB49_025471 [Dermacentor silvarum]